MTKRFTVVFLIGSSLLLFLIFICVIVLRQNSVDKKEGDWLFHIQPDAQGIADGQFNEPSQGQTTKKILSLKENAGKQKDRVRRRFPNAIIIGVKKGGTRALISMLSSHPNIKVASKEVQFFSYNYNRGLNWYIEQMPSASKNKVTMEKSPNYFDIGKVPKRVHDASETVKLLLIVRNPLDRAVSDYVQYVEQEAEAGRKVTQKFEGMVVNGGKVIFNNQLKFIERSMYDVHYKRWRKFFSKDQILVLDGDELINNPNSVLQQAEEFLNVPNFFQKDMFIFNEKKGFYCWNTTSKIFGTGPLPLNHTEEDHCLGSSKGRPHPNVSKNISKKLKTFFRPHMSKFCSDASVQFSWCSL